MADYMLDPPDDDEPECDDDFDYDSLADNADDFCDEESANASSNWQGERF